MKQFVQDAVLAVEQERCQAMLQADVRALHELIAPELYFSHATGAVDDRAAYLSKVAAGRITYRAISWSEQQVMHLAESVALLTGRMTSVVLVENREKQLDNRVMAVWHFSDRWRLRAFQSTPLARP